MTSSYKGLDLFGSGPHRFSQGRQGEVLVNGSVIGLYGPQTFAQGLRELEVFVRGRLVAPDEQTLWQIRDAIVAQLIHPPAPGTRIDLHGRSWEDMSFIEFAEQDRTDRGRVLSIGYVAIFRRMIDPFLQI